MNRGVPNHRAALDAATAPCSRMWRHLRGASERGRSVDLHRYENNIITVQI